MTLQDRHKIERCNLISICKLVMKSLIDSSLSKGYKPGSESDDIHLERFLIVLENILYHESRGKKGLLKESRDVWRLIEHLGCFSRNILDMVTSIRDMSNIKTGLGRTRAWLRLAMMQKKLAEYFALMVEHRMELGDFYEPGSLMMADELSVICGLLVGINFLDCIIVFKDEDLDMPLGVIDYSSYLKEVVPSENTVETPAKSEDKNDVNLLIEQKHYLEELNKNQSSSLANLTRKMDSLTSENILLQEEVTTTKLSLVQLQKENVLLQNENLTLCEVHKKQIINSQMDIQTERDTYNKSRLGLNALCEETEKVLNDQVQMRLDLEKELEVQIGLKQELEVGMRLLERDIHEKQDFITSLRTQLDDVKALNIQLTQKAEELESALQHKTEMISKLELKNSQMTFTIKEMEIELKTFQCGKKELEELFRNLESQLTAKDQEREVVETDLKMEREWRVSLQNDVDAERVKVFKLNSELCSLKKEYDSLVVQRNELQKLCGDQEKALTELGSHLSESKLKVENMMEAQLSLMDAQWTDDKTVSECMKCQKTFSVSRRKHHCRSCGEIFCNDCSNTKMPLPSFPKPVRVCDTCSDKLLKRFCS